MIVGLALNYPVDSIQRANISAILSLKLDGRLVPHRVNRVNKLQAILGEGIGSLEVDLLFRFDGQRGHFEVGHDEIDASGVDLAAFLDIIKAHCLKKIWLDIKNVREDNIDALLAELLRLDSLYGIRQTAIIESNLVTEGLRKVGQAGFHSSYYLPTQKIKALLSGNDRALLQAAAAALAEQIASQGVAAVSFDLALYPFVKNYLETVIPATVVYHTWDSMKLWELNAIRDLKERAYFNDSRVMTILYEYWGAD